MSVGRPLAYEPEILYETFLSYIQFCCEEKKFVNIAGFARFADINLDTFYEYKNNRKEFSETIKKIENILEDEALNSKDTIKSIFYLKNKFGYKDKQEIEQTVSGVEVVFNCPRPKKD